MTGLSGKYAIVGVGESDVGRHLGRTGMALHLEAITRALADQEDIIRKPVHIVEKINKLKKAASEYSQQNGVDPTPVERVAYLKKELSKR